MVNNADTNLCKLFLFMQTFLQIFALVILLDEP